MVPTRHLAALLCVTALAGCELARNPVSSDPTMSGVAPNFSNASGAQERVTGNGQLTVGGELRTFAFTAVRHHDGSVSGEYQLISRATGAKIHAELTCFSIVGNAAWIGGIITNALDPAFEGTETAYRVVDSGEGSGAAPDELSLAFVGGGPGFANGYCNARPPAPALHPIEGGNIQVH